MRLARGALLLALCLGCAGLARAGERTVESFEGEHRFATRWPGGSVTLGGSAGLHWATIATEGRGKPIFVTNATPYAPAIDARDRFVKIWLRVDDPNQLGGLELRLSSDDFASSYFALPFRTYEDPDFDSLSRAGWSVLTFSFGNARRVGTPKRDAIDSIGLYLVDRGEAPLSLRWGGLALVDEAPQGVLSITFDDGYDEHYGAAQRMARHGFRGTAYVIPDSVGQPGYLTLRQAVALRERYDWDVAAHHQTPLTEMGERELEDAILGIQRFLGEKVAAEGGLHLAYPLGRQDAGTRSVVRKHFHTARIAAAGPETLPPGDRHLLRVFNVLDTTTPDEIGAAARAAREHKQWLILMFHFLVPNAQNSLEYGIDDFERALGEIARSGIDVLPVSEVWAACERSGTNARCEIPKSLPVAVPAAPAPCECDGGAEEDAFPASLAEPGNDELFRLPGDTQSVPLDAPGATPPASAPAL